MARRTGIGWTGATYNPWQGCRKKSRACKFCYMFRDKRRYGQDPLNIHRSSKATFDAPLKWQREVDRGDRVGQGRLVFTCSWSDWFIKEADAWRDDAWAIIKACPDLLFQVLTKRSERIADHTPWVATGEAPWPNVWLGVSVENQEFADERIPELAAVPAAIRFLSAEPLLGPIDIRPWSSWIHQVITGGESGDEAGVDPTHPDWVRSLRDQCQGSGIAFHHKQWGEWLPISEMSEEQVDRAYHPFSKAEIERYGEDGCRELLIRKPRFSTRPVGYDGGDHWQVIAGHPAYQTFRVGKKASGRTLDGKIWDEFPVALEHATS